MAVLDRRAGAAVENRIDFDAGPFLDPILGIVREEMWDWFHENEDDVLLRVRKWFFSVSVRVHHLEPLFEMLFGPSPYDSESPNPFSV